ncbi:thermonuclease family protein [Neisseria iguanae]|uniref:thermonuclease family protein n=1 Tax=Neisseria iguanae TaxID=90242 RepID=UPI001FEC3BDD|nr:thermonuclease family protein [Neisseria iguanae]
MKFRVQSCRRSVVSLTVALLSAACDWSLFGEPSAIRPSAEEQTVSCRIVGISDGDTLTCLTEQKRQIKVRLHGIDAPEKAQAYGQKAKRHLSDLVYGKTVMLDVTDTDRYGRTVAVVFSGSLNVNRQMVKDGYAWAYHRYGSAYEADETVAKSARKGLWWDTNPIDPAEFRQNERK